MPDQLALDGTGPVPVLTTSASGTSAPLEDHETLSLFTPAPAVMPGQQSLGELA